MIAVKNQSYATLLFAILFIGAGLSQPLNSISADYPEADFSDSLDSHSFLHARVLERIQIPCSSWYPRTTGSIKGQSLLEYEICVAANSEITIEIEVGKPKYVLQVTLSSTVTIDEMETDIELFPGDLSDTEDGTTWSKSLTIDSSSFSLRKLTFTIENPAYPQTTVSTLSISVISTVEDDDSFSINLTPSWIGPVAGVIGFVVVIGIIICCICHIRRARLRRMALRQRSRAAYRANEVDQPQPPAQQPAQFPPQYQAQHQGQLQAPIMYQPINPNPSQNYQFQPAIQLVQVPAQDYQYPQYPNYQGYQLAPMQIIMPNQNGEPMPMPDMNEGPLSEMNFDHRFPEAPLQNFVSSFPQKTCSICLEDLKVNQNCRQLYCEHIFHGECAKVWLLNQMTKQNHGFCPNCNKNMTFVVERAKS